MLFSGKTQQRSHHHLQLSCPWLKRVGFYGFLFFLVKGMLWLTIPAVLGYLGLNG